MRILSVRMSLRIMIAAIGLMLGPLSRYGQNLAHVAKSARISSDPTLLTMSFLAMRRPAMEVPLPPITFEADCMTMSAPSVSGRVSAGEAHVESTNNGMSKRCASSAMVSMSNIDTDGLDGNSP